MFDGNEKSFQETEAAFAVAVSLLNLLVLAAFLGIVWLMYFLISPNSPLSAALGEAIWR